MAKLGVRSTPGLHSLMTEVGMRHATLWFAGEAGNWPLADYLAQELEEVLEEAAALHPEYSGLPVGRLLEEMSTPAPERVEEAIDAGDRAQFAQAYDALTASCNACHQATAQGMLVIQRPTAPSLTNLRFPR